MLAQSLDRPFTVSRQWLNFLFLVGLTIFVATGIWNIGIIAMDDYYDMFNRIFPVQQNSIQTIVDHAGYRYPVPHIFVFGLGKIAYALGMTHPLAQFRFALATFATMAYLMHAIFGLGQLKDDTSGQRRAIYLLLLSFYFASPLFLTRTVMIESLSAPFVTMSAYFAFRYFDSKRVVWIFAAMAAMTGAAAFRVQAGAVFVGLFVLVLFMKQWKHLPALFLSAGLGYVAIGLGDLYLRGEFHKSFWLYFYNNLENAHKCGVTPFYNFTLLFLALSIPPVFFLRYRGFEWTKRYRNLVPALLYFVTFVGIHSCVGHKEERFMIPILATFLLLLVPLLQYLVFEKKSRWRVGLFVGINLILMPLATINIPQSNAIGMIKYLEKRPQVKEVFSVEESLVMIPTGFVEKAPQVNHCRAADVGTIPMNCEKMIAVRDDIRPLIQGLDTEWQVVKRFKPGVLEQIVVWTNPHRNTRRGAITLYADKSCNLES